MADERDDLKALRDEELERELIQDEMAIVYRDLQDARAAGDKDRVADLEAQMLALKERKRLL